MRIRSENDVVSACKLIHQKLHTLFLSIQDIESAAGMAELIGEFAHHNHYGVYFDKEIEDHLYQLANKLPRVESPATEAISDKKRVLHVVTKAYLSGGHTRVIENWCEITEKTYSNSVVITDQQELPIPKKLSDCAESLTVLAGVSYQRRAQMLAELINENNIVILHTHPNDVLPILAVGMISEQTSKLYFYNNSDHAFAFNISVCTRVLENSAFGFAISAKKRMHGKLSSYVPLPLNPAMTSMVKQDVADDGYLLSTGSAYKFQPYEDMDYAQFALKVAKRTERKFIVVGPDRKRDPRWQNVYDKSNGLVDAVGGIAHDRYIDLLSNASAYVESFPYIGGIAFSEALLAGIPTFGLQMHCSGYSPLDEIRSQSQQDLEEKLEAFFTDSNFRIQHVSVLQRLQCCIIDYQIGSGFESHLKQVLDDMRLDQNVPYFAHLQNTEYFEDMWAEQGVMKFDHKLLARMPVKLALISAWTIAAGAQARAKVFCKMSFDAIRKR